MRRAGAGAFPLVLAGGCISATGTVAGCGAQGAVWLDAHADLDTPDDNAQRLDGRHGAVAPVRVGLARPARDDRQRGRDPPRSDVALLGVRDLAPYQRDRLAVSALRTVPGAFDVGAATAAITAAPGSRLYLHVDLDVLDTSVGHANRYAVARRPVAGDRPGGHRRHVRPRDRRGRARSPPTSQPPTATVASSPRARTHRGAASPSARSAQR